MAEKKRIGKKAKIIIAAVVVLVILGAIGSGNGNEESGKSNSTAGNQTTESQVAEGTATESPEPENQASEGTVSSSASANDDVRLDELQEAFLEIGEDTTAADLKAMANEHGWALGEYQHKSGKYTHYILAYDSGVAKEKYADNGACLEADISDDGKCSGIQYSDDSVLLATVLGSGVIHDATAYDGYGFGERDSNNNVKYGSREEALRAYVAKMNEVAAERGGE